MNPAEALPPEVAIPLSITLWLIYWVMGSKERRQSRLSRRNEGV